MTKTQDQRPKSSDVAALLLAAGRSRRMGVFKPLLPFGNTTVIHSCIQNLRAAGVQDIVVVLGHRAAEVESSLKDLELLFALNPDPESEMSSSIAHGVQQLPDTAKAVLIALSDQPAIPPAAIEAVVAEWKMGAKLVVPQFQGRGGHPVLVDLIFRQELFNLDPQQGLRSLFAERKAQVHHLPVRSPFIVRDMDTWDDYCALHEKIFGIRPDNVGG